MKRLKYCVLITTFAASVAGALYGQGVDEAEKLREQQLRQLSLQPDADILKGLGKHSGITLYGWINKFKSGRDVQSLRAICSFGLQNKAVASCLVVVLTDKVQYGAQPSLASKYAADQLVMKPDLALRILKEALLPAKRDKAPQTAAEKAESNGTPKWMISELGYALYDWLWGEVRNTEIESRAIDIFEKIQRRKSADSGDLTSAYVVALKHGEIGTKLRVLRLLELLGARASGAVDSLLPLVYCRDEDLRVASVKTLTAFGSRAAKAVPALIRSHAEYPSAQTIRALGAIGPAARPAVPRIREALDDNNPEYRRWARWALAQIGAGENRTGTHKDPIAPTADVATLTAQAKKDLASNSLEARKLAVETLQSLGEAGQLVLVREEIQQLLDAFEHAFFFAGGLPPYLRNRAVGPVPALPFSRERLWNFKLAFDTPVGSPSASPLSSLKSVVRELRKWIVPLRLRSANLAERSLASLASHSARSIVSEAVDHAVTRNARNGARLSALYSHKARGGAVAPDWHTRWDGNRVDWTASSARAFAQWPFRCSPNCRSKTHANETMSRKLPYEVEAAVASEADFKRVVYHVSDPFLRWRYQRVRQLISPQRNKIADLLSKGGSGGAEVAWASSPVSLPWTRNEVLTALEQARRRLAQSKAAKGSANRTWPPPRNIKYSARHACIDGYQYTHGQIIVSGRARRSCSPACAHPYHDKNGYQLPAETDNEWLGLPLGKKLQFFSELEACGKRQAIRKFSLGRKWLHALNSNR